MRLKPTATQVGRYIYYIVQVYNKTFLSSVEGMVDRERKKERGTTAGSTIVKLTPVKRNILLDPILHLILHSWKAPSP